MRGTGVSSWDLKLELSLLPRNGVRMEGRGGGGKTEEVQSQGCVLAWG